MLFDITSSKKSSHLHWHPFLF